MQYREKSIAQFFTTVDHLPANEVDSAFVSVSSFVVGKAGAATQNKIVLKDNLLLVAAKEGTGYVFTHGLHLQSPITFRKIAAKAEKAQHEPCQLTGFRLIDADGHFVDFLLPFPALTCIWLQQLARLINQLGFPEEFELVRKLGKGSTACVFEVRRREDGKLLAAKVVLKGYLKQRQEREKALEAEIALLRAIEHENVIRLEGVFESEQAVYLLFERLEGGTLLEFINSQRGLSLAQTRMVMRGIAEGLAYLHRFGIAHRDLKLENILLQREEGQEGSERWRAVIADFGLAVLVEEEPYLFYRCGTPGYVAPEIIRMRQNRPVRVACDIFSAGAILHLLLTNSYLFPATTSQEVYRLNCEAKITLTGQKYEKLDAAALQLLRKMLAVRPSDRITAEEMLQQAFLASQGQLEGQEKQAASPAVTQAGDSLSL